MHEPGKYPRLGYLPPHSYMPLCTVGASLVSAIRWHHPTSSKPSSSSCTTMPKLLPNLESVTFCLQHEIRNCTYLQRFSHTPSPLLFDCRRRWRRPLHYFLIWKALNFYFQNEISRNMHTSLGSFSHTSCPLPVVACLALSSCFSTSEHAQK